MTLNTRFSWKIPAFHGRVLPEIGSVVGYDAIIDSLELQVPIPETVAIICEKNKKYETNGWKVLFKEN